MRRAPLFALAALLASALPAAPAEAGGTVKDICRLDGQGQFVIRGVGLVVGLAGTGDSGKELTVARPLAELLKNNGNAVALPSELDSSKAVALVSVTCVIPERGGKTGDNFDVIVSVLNSAKSLKGGQLYLTALLGPYRTSPAYALAEGPVDLEPGGVETRGRVRGGARLIRDATGPEVGDTFDLVLDAPFAGWAASSQVALAINSKAQPDALSNPGVAAVARSIDDRTVRVTIPEAERADKAGFIADVLSAEVALAQLELPAQVIYNQRTGAIVVTGDVEISPVAITHKDLTITTLTPPPTASAQSPLVSRDRWAGVRTGAKPAQSARLSDLLAALKQLDVSPADQIGILQMLHKTGKLQAKLVMD